MEEGELMSNFDTLEEVETLDVDSNLLVRQGDIDYKQSAAVHCCAISKSDSDSILSVRLINSCK
jgi:hypothetical protein